MLLCCRYRSTSHTDFVQGLAWATEDKLYTCGWDSKIYKHSVPGLDQSVSTESGPVNMEVNGEPAECDDSKIDESVPTKCKVNGIGDQEDINKQVEQET